MGNKKRAIIVIGGGASGMMAAISAAYLGQSVTLIEKNEKLGKKLYITGKGKCNLTNACDLSVFFENVVRGQKFLRSAVHLFSNDDLMHFFENNGLRLKVERGERVFPASDKSSDVIKTLEKVLKSLKVKILFDCEALDILTEDAHFKGVKVRQKGKLSVILGDALVIACGGQSYPTTGSDGSGCKFARNLGHKITDTEPSLVSLICDEDYVGRLEGLSLKNVEVKIVQAGKKKALYREFGEMLFTDKGVSGPLILTASALIGRKINESFKNKSDPYKLYIDLKPALSYDQLDKRILRDFDENKNRNFKNVLRNLLPAKLIPVIIELSKIDADKKVNSITRNERAGLLELLMNFPLTLVKTGGFEEAVVTSGGVDLDEIIPSTMESRLVKGVYFAGEVIDADAFTGGFNLQIAFSTGYLAGESAAKGDI